MTGADLLRGPLPARVDRGFSSSPSAEWPIEDFRGATGTSEQGIPLDVPNIAIDHISGQPLGSMDCPDPLLPLKYVPNHDPDQRAASIAWTRGGADVYLQVNLARPGSAGFDATAIAGFGAAKTLEFRVSRRVLMPAPQKDASGTCSLLTPIRTDPLNVEASTSFSILLEGTDGTLSSPVDVRNYMVGANLAGPVGMLTYGTPEVSPILQTVRISLGDFAGSDAILRKLRGVRFAFDRTASGAISLANIRFGKTVAPPPVQTAPSVQQSVASWPLAAASRAIPVREKTFTASITSIRSVASSAALGGARGVEIEVSSDRAFPIRNAILTLHVGDRSTSLSNHPDGDMTRAVFTLDADEFASIPDGSTASVRYGGSPSELAVEVGRVLRKR